MLDGKARFLYYFRTEDDFEQFKQAGVNSYAGAIDLSTAWVYFYIDDIMDGRPGLLEITTPKRFYFFHSAVTDKVKEWMRVLGSLRVPLLIPEKKLAPAPNSPYKFVFCKQGFLEKRGELNTSYQKRFCRLIALSKDATSAASGAPPQSGVALAYWRLPHDVPETALGFISLRNATIISAPAEPGNAGELEFQIQVEDSGRVFAFRVALATGGDAAVNLAAARQEKAEWFAAIENGRQVSSKHDAPSEPPESSAAESAKPTSDETKHGGGDGGQGAGSDAPSPAPAPSEPKLTLSHSAALEHKTAPAAPTSRELQAIEAQLEEERRRVAAVMAGAPQAKPIAPSAPLQAGGARASVVLSPPPRTQADVVSVGREGGKARGRGEKGGREGWRGEGGKREGKGYAEAS